MYQIIFNEISAAEMDALPRELQLGLLEEFAGLPENLDDLDSEKFGRLERDGRTLHRYRTREHRIYFERRPEGITIHRVLHRNSLQDFLFRSRLSSPEDEQLSKKDEFWKLIEDGAKAGKKR